MINSLLTKVIGSRNDRMLKKLHPIVDQVNALESEIEGLDDAALVAKGADFRKRFEAGETLDEMLPEAFAVVRAGSKRVLGMRHFDVQLIGGVILHQGIIAEMKTGEGKTLMSTLPAYLNALGGASVHIVTVNDYLARRDSEWMGQLFEFLGLTVGCIQHDMDDAARKAAYNADITYGTNNEFGFDYLRDNMKFSVEAQVQRGHHFAVVDEVDSILIDEARTPLIISGPADDSTDKYFKIDRIIPRLKKGAVTQGETKGYELEHTGDYIVDEKSKSVTLTEPGVEHCQELLGIENLYDPSNMSLVHHVNQALKAHVLFKCDVDYMIKDGQVVIVDEFTGRLMPGRRWSDGLHQAVEAKEGVRVERENQTLATITFQNYFRMYDKLSGMTGTADTEAIEFDKIYELQVAVVPTNQPMVRKDQPDVIYRTDGEKWIAVVEEIKAAQEAGQPALVGTVSIESSELLAKMLRQASVKHVVLNAKYHEMEAEIVAQAGRLGAVTIATNMAGRGTDIVLGGNAEFLARRTLAEGGTKPAETPKDEWDAALAEALVAAKKQCADEKDKVRSSGGLLILGTERHESRRIDNQLRGRAGRQGDPGESRFFLSMDDDLMRIFAGEKMKAALKTLGMEEGVPIESGMVSRAIERAQKQVEQRNFEVRKHLLEYDDVNNKQRTEIYGLRRGLLEGIEQKEFILDNGHAILEELVAEHLGSQAGPEDWDLLNFRQQLKHTFGMDLADGDEELRAIKLDEVAAKLWPPLAERYEAKETRIGPERMREYERHLMMQIIDATWKDHLLAMDHMKEGIGLRAYGQRDPLIEYKKESFEMFGQTRERIENDAVRYLFLLEPMTDEERARQEERRRAEQDQIFRSASQAKAGVTAKGGIKTVKKDAAKVGRNSPCSCGSGKKFKRCCGA